MVHHQCCAGHDRCCGIVHYGVVVLSYAQAGVMEGAISNRIRTLRFHNAEMSQAELGQRIGVTRQTIAAIEAGKTRRH